MAKRLAVSNIITAAIDHLGGGSTGVKRVGVLLDLTTQRVYQLVRKGVVRKAQHARILADATGLPFEEFLLKPDETPNGGGPDGGGRRDPKESPPLTLVPTSVSSTGGAESSPRLCLGSRGARVVRPCRSCCFSHSEPLAA